MAVVTKTAPEAAPRNPVTQLVISSFLGALFVLASLGLIFGQLPLLWELLPLSNPFLSEALLFITTLVVMAGLGLVALKLEGRQPPPGQRAGIAVAAIGLFFIVLISLGFGNTLIEGMDAGAWGGLIGAAIGAAAMGFGLLWLFRRPGFYRRLLRLEAQGWFHFGQYKGSQGVRVRRATLVGLLVVIGCGIVTMINHGTLGTGDWVIDIPGTGEIFGTQLALYLMFRVNVIGPVVILFGLIFVAWRVINWPVFADFLIATEAELNKVSWTTRRRLTQDTIVVLVTVALMAFFLFVVDICWIRVLSSWPIEVLKVDLSKQKSQQQSAQDW
jgi:preprotein translocase SecE subunit